MTTILMLGNSDLVIWNFRKELVDRFIKEGYEVYISSPYGNKIKNLRHMGCHYIETPIERHGTNIIKDAKLFLNYLNWIHKIKPDYVLTYTIKPNIYGAFASAILKVPYLVNITGLGIAIENQSLFSRAVFILYRFAVRGASCVFFQNRSNMQQFCKGEQGRYRCRLLPGSGVNIEEFAYFEYPPQEQDVMFLLLGRIMRDKGVEEFLGAARIIKESYTSVNFVIAGECESDYCGNLEQAVHDGIVSYVGFQPDVHSLLKKAYAVVLPSYHEGLSNVLLEASACGRPVLASRIPGCQETFEEKITGIGFEPRNVKSLAEALKDFILLPYETKKQMGISAREKIEREFNRDIVIEAYLDEINKIHDTKGHKIESL